MKYEKKFDKKRCDVETHYAVVFDRQGNVVYHDPKSGEPRIKNVLEVASDENLINQFNANIAFSIGVFSASLTKLKMLHPAKITAMRNPESKGKIFMFVLM